jgi:signal transduction histidine kinase
MNLYSNKQKWKIVLLIFALLLVGASLFVSNRIVSKVGERERERAEQWADAIRKKVELVKLTNSTFSQLREKERKKMELWIDATKEVSRASNLTAQVNYDLPLKIISDNNDIPVIVVDNENIVSGFRNLDFDTTELRKAYPELNPSELNSLFEDSLIKLSKSWSTKNPSFTIEVYEGLFMTYYYNDSKEIVRLENERDSLISSFNTDLINNEGLVPVLLIDEATKSVVGTNISTLDSGDESLEEVIARLEVVNKPIQIDINDKERSLLYYDNSPELKQLQYFPYIQFLLIGLFGLIGYLIFSTFRKAEQNQVWAGMAKETAHQLGTPLSSLMAWVQLLESQGTDKMITEEMQKDIDRLEKVTDRFSKIGSGAKLENAEISKTVSNIVTYLRPRISDKVDVQTDIPGGIFALHNPSLIEWVVENICKNAVDAMEGEGHLKVSMSTEQNYVHIDIKDSGKGIPPNQYKRVFEPGYSTKKRGWGLGLSLVKRIVKDYHKGRVYVLESRIDEGTTFRISIPL